MSIIRKGITGFWQEGAEEPPPRVHYREFMRLCNFAATILSGSLVRAREDGPAHNYYFATIEYARGHFNVLCNAQFPFVAISEVFELPPFGVGPRYLDNEEAEQALMGVAGFEIVKRNELNREVTEEERAILSAAENAQVQYWRSRTVGEIVFNHYD